MACILALLAAYIFRWEEQDHDLATTAFEKDYAQVWCHSGPNTSYQLQYWRVVMQAAWHKLHKPGNKPASEVYRITNKKAVNALRCDLCKHHATFAVYKDLALYC